MDNENINKSEQGGYLVPEEYADEIRALMAFLREPIPEPKTYHKVKSFEVEWQYGAYHGQYTFHIESDQESKNLESDSEVFRDGRWWLFEGNFSCDCNRVDAWLKFYSVFPWKFHNKYDWKLEDDQWGCTNDVIFNNVNFYRDGRLIGSGSDIAY